MPTDRTPLTTVRLPDGNTRDVYTQAELDDLTANGARPVEDASWRPRTNRRDARRNGNYATAGVARSRRSNALPPHPLGRDHG